MQNLIYTDDNIKTLNSVKVVIAIPLGNSETEEISFISTNKNIIFITSNYYELREEYKDDKEFLRILIDAIFSCKEISMAQKSTWKRWNCWNISFFVHGKRKISDVKQESYIYEQIEECCDYLSNTPLSVKRKYEALKNNIHLEWRDK